MGYEALKQLSMRIKPVYQIWKSLHLLQIRLRSMQEVERIMLVQTPLQKL